MKNIKLRYRLQFSDRIETIITNIESLERQSKDFSKATILSRDLWIGLEDKKGKDIYSGDIVKVLDRDWPSQLNSYPKMNHQQYLDFISSICEVVWYKDAFILKQLKGRGNYDDRVAKYEGRDVYEVIGNIYENPELL